LVGGKEQRQELGQCVEPALQQLPNVGFFQMVGQQSRVHRKLTRKVWGLVHLSEDL